MSSLQTLSSDSSLNNKQPWMKILYKKQNYEDNYTSSHYFLQGLRTNTSFEPFRISELIFESLSISIQVSAVALFSLIYLSLSEIDSILINEPNSTSCSWMFFSPFSCFSTLLSKPNIIPSVLLPFFGDLSLLTFIISVFIKVVIIDETFSRKSQLSAKLKDSLKSVSANYGDSIQSMFIFLISLSATTPILSTLTTSISDDTILSLSFFLLLLHLFSFPYPFVKREEDFALSLNSSIFVSILLSSRLHFSFFVFSFFLCSIALFVILPTIIFNLRTMELTTFYIYFSISLILCVGLLSYFQSTIVHLMFLSIIIFVTFVAPSWLIIVQQYKHEIHGPWDEAILPPSIQQT